MQFTGPWDDGAAIPTAFTCDGAGDAPLITWTAPPAGTAELALSVTDADANGFVHWLVVELPAQAGSLGGGEPTAVGVEAVNSFGEPGWGGPCPPQGGGPHTYVFTLHLLDQQLELPADAPTADLLAAIDASTAESATFAGTYERA
jgi:Raf kinase inhibitor-like YbhB/YbcL family protein